MAQSDAISSTPKKSQIPVRILGFYSKHFPTDKTTYNIRIPVVGLVLSLLSLQFVNIFLWVEYFVIFRLFTWAYVILAVAAGCQLHWGLRIGDRKQFTPWILLKLVEIAFVLAEIIDGLYKYRYDADLIVGEIVFGFFLWFANIGIAYVVINKSLRHNKVQMRNRPGAPHNGISTLENIYDFPQMPVQYDNEV